MSLKLTGCWKKEINTDVKMASVVILFAFSFVTEYSCTSEPCESRCRSFGYQGFALAIAFVLVLGGCTTTRFYADFESDTIGQFPAFTPAGEPSDDLIIIRTDQPTDDRPAIVVSVEAAPLGSDEMKVLSFSLGGDIAPLVRFRSSPMTTDDGRILVSWRQMITGPGEAELFFSIDPEKLLPGQNFEACIVTVRFSGIFAGCDGNPSSNIIVTDISPFEPHMVFLTINRRSATAVFEVVQDGVGSAQTNRGMRGGPEVAEDERLSVQIVYRGEGPGGFTIDRFKITELD